MRVQYWTQGASLHFGGLEEDNLFFRETRSPRGGLSPPTVALARDDDRGVIVTDFNHLQRSGRHALWHIPRHRDKFTRTKRP